MNQGNWKAAHRSACWLKNNIIDCQCWLQCLAMWKCRLWMLEKASSRLAITNRHDSQMVNCRLARLGIG